VSSHREVERTYDPPADAELPDLTRLDGVLVAESSPEIELEATYFDTPGLDLLANRVTLRRRTGGGDEGWHLKLPAGVDTREEIHLPLSRGRHLPPKALRDLVLAITHGRELTPVATIHTRRTETALRGDSGVLAELADDRVAAHRTLAGDEPRLLSWREWEFELVGGDAALLAAADALLTRAGAGVASTQTKLGRVIGDATPAAPVVKRPRKGKPVARVLHAYLLAQVEQVLASDRAVRRREPEGIHDLRVALRRLRTSLATFRPLVDRDTTDPLRDEMRWVSLTLGTARDAEVVRERLHELLDDEVPSAALKSARAVLAAAGRVDAREARQVADETLRSERYLAVISALQSLVADPPWTKLSEQKSAKVLPQLISDDVNRMRKRVRLVDKAGDPEERTARLHEVRKAAKRLRYACEAAEPVLGAKVARVESAAKDIQSLLGDHHDTVLTRSWLLQLADATSADGTFTLGHLHAREEAEAARLEGEFVEAWKNLERHAR
jgi:CHAD domain-containing protein